VCGRRKPEEQTPAPDGRRQPLLHAVHGACAAAEPWVLLRSSLRQRLMRLQSLLLLALLRGAVLRRRAPHSAGSGGPLALTQSP
jgi:hypothetical protein